MSARGESIGAIVACVLVANGVFAVDALVIERHEVATCAGPVHVDPCPSVGIYMSAFVLLIDMASAVGVAYVVMLAWLRRPERALEAP